jgi:hypothetical protein
MMSFLKRHSITVAIVVVLSVALAYLALQSLDDSADYGFAASNDYEAAIQLANLENRSIHESSGIAASRSNADIFWTHNDSGDGPVIYAFDRQGKDRGTWRVTGALALDWEDVAIGPGPERGRSYLYIADIGDNIRMRDQITVYRVPEPRVVGAGSAGARYDTETAEAIRLRYPDGKHDAEAVLIHPSTGDLYIVTKIRGSPARVYKLSAPITVSETLALTYIGEVRVPNGSVGQITGGDISPDGQRVILCDYRGAYELELPAGQNAAFDTVWRVAPSAVSLGDRRQGEAVCYRADGLALLATSERLPCPLIEVGRRSPPR